MASTKHQYIMTLARKKGRISRGQPMDCYRCGKLVEIGDSVFTKPTPSRSHLYHIDCAKEVNLL